MQSTQSWKFIAAMFLRMDGKTWWGSEGGQSSGKALSCALEVRGRQRRLCDQECQEISMGHQQMASGASVVKASAFQQHLITADPTQEGN